jgi:hypothetical protein
MRASVIAACVVAMASSPVAAEPDSDDAEVRRLYERGQAHYRSGEYRAAARIFLRAYDLRALPELLFNAAQAHRLAGSCATSATLYRRYLERADSPRGRAVIERHLAAMDACVARRQRQPAKTPAPPSQRDAAEGPGDRDPDTAGWVIAGAGAALAVTSGLLVWDAGRQSDRVSEVFERGGAWTEAEAGAARRGERSETLAWVTGVAGAAALVTGAVLLVRDDGERSSPRLGAVPGGAVVGWAWGF